MLPVLTENRLRVFQGIQNTFVVLQGVCSFETILILNLDPIRLVQNGALGVLLEISLSSFAPVLGEVMLCGHYRALVEK